MPKDGTKHPVAPSAKRIISYIDVVKAKSMQDEMGKLKDRLKEVQALYTPLETKIITEIESKVPFEAGCPPCAVHVEHGDRRPKWKDEYITRLGQKEADKVVEGTLPGPDKKTLIINPA